MRIWSASTGAEEHAIKFGPNLQYVAVSPIGDAVAAITDEITIFSAGRGNRLAKAKGHGRYGGEVRAEFLPDGSRLVTVGRDDVMLWDTSTGKRLAKHEHEDGECFFQLAVAPDGERIAVRSSYALRVHAATDLRVMSSFEEEGTGGALGWTQVGLAGSHDGTPGSSARCFTLVPCSQRRASRLSGEQDRSHLRALLAEARLENTRLIPWYGAT